MKRPGQTPKAVAQRDALRQQTETKHETAETSVSPSFEHEPKRFYRNERGELAVSRAGLLKLQTTFTGSSVDRDADPKSCTDLENARLAQAAGALPYAGGKCGVPEALNIALDAVASLAPRDGMEVMLCSQLVALHSQSMDFLRRGMLEEQTCDGVDRNVTRATKLLRTFATMAECLRTYRGGGQQKMVVEHVTVQAGGQAIVGTIHRRVGDRDANNNSE